MSAGGLSTEERLRVLLAAAAAVQTARTPQEILEVSASELGKLGWRVAIYMLDSDGHTLRLRHNSLPAAPEADISIRTAPLLKRVIETCSPVFIPAGERNQADGLDALGDAPGGLSLAPIAQHDSGAGVLVVMSEDALNAGDLQAVGGFAGHIAVALESAALRSSLEAQIEQLAVLHDVSLEIAVELDEGKLLKAICDHAARMLQVTGVGLWMITPERDALELVAGYNPHNPYTGMRLRLDEGVAGQVASSGQPLAIEDYSRWERRLPQYPSRMFFGVLGVPLVWRGSVLGVLVASDTRQPRRFTPGDIRLLALWAQQAVVAVQNARAYRAEQDRRRLAEIFHDAVAALGSHLVLDDVLELVLEFLEKIITCTSCSISLVSDQDVLRIAAARGFDNISELKGARWKIADDLKVRTMLTTRRPFIIGDTRLDAQWLHIPGSDRIRAWLGAPLMIGDRLVGVLNVDHEQPNFYRSEDAETAAMFAGQVVAAIENAQLYAQAQQRVCELQGLNDIALAFSAMVNVRDMAHLVTERVARVLSADKCAILLFSPDQREARALFPAHGLTEEQAARLRFPLGGEPRLDFSRQDARVIVNDLAELSPALRFLFFSIGIRSLAVATMTAREQMLGALLVANRAGTAHAFESFASEDVAWLASVAAQAAIALDNARLYEEMARQQTYYQSVIDSTGAVIYTVDRELRLTSFSAEWDRTIAQNGHSELLSAYLLGRPLMEFFTHPARARWSTLCTMILSGGQGEEGPLHHEEIEVETTGDHQTFYLTAGPLKDHAGAVTGIIFVSQDLTAQKTAERAAQQRARELAALYAISTAANQSLELTTVLDHALPVVANISGADGVQAYVLEDGQWRLAAHTGQLAQNLPECNQLPTLAIQAISDGEPLVIPDLSQADSDVESAFRCGEMLAQVYMPLHARRRLLGALRLGWRRPYSPAERDLTLWLSIGRQISVAMVNAQLYQASERRERKTRALYEIIRQLALLDMYRSPENVLPRLYDLVEYDIAGMLVSQGAGRLFMHVAGLVGQAAVEQMEKRLVDEYYMLGLSQLDGAGLERVILGVVPEAHTGEGTLTSFVIAPLSIGQRILGVLALGSQRDVTYSDADQRMLLTLGNQIAIAVENARLYQVLQDRAHALERAYAELKESDRLKDELVQNVSHELRTPLTFIKGYVQLLLEGGMGELTPAQHQSLDIVVRKTDMLTRLVGSIVTLERVGRAGLHAQPMSLAEQANLVLDTCAATSRLRRVTLACDFPPVLSLVVGDRDQISEVFDNLLSNALKFTPAGGAITVRGREEGEFVRVEVSDTGIGIPSDKLDKIFERFYQVDGTSRRKFGGAGLGLAIVKEIIHAHGGQVGVMSELGRGSTFYFTLPKAPAAQDQVERDSTEGR